MRKRMPLLVVLVLIVTACSAAAASPVATAVPTATQEVLPTPTIAPSATPEPTATAEPTPTSMPTAEPFALQPELEYEAFMTLLGLADILYQNGDFAGAIIIYSEMLAHRMDVAAAEMYALRADAYDALGDFEAAIADYIRAIELGEQSASILNNLCWDYGITGQPELALPYCEQANQKDPSPAHRDSRGVVYAQLGMIEEALADFEAVVADLEGTTSPELQVIYNMRRGWIDTLQSGENPIMPEVLVELQQETAVATPEPPATEVDMVVTRTQIQEVAEQVGFLFGAVTEVGGQESVTGEMSQGECSARIALAGSASGVESAALWLTECDDETKSGYAIWFLTQILYQDADITRAMVWMVTDVYYVIEGQEESTAPRQIGDITLTARNVSVPELVFELTAMIGTSE